MSEINSDRVNLTHDPLNQASGCSTHEFQEAFLIRLDELEIRINSLENRVVCKVHGNVDRKVCTGASRCLV